MDKLIYDGVEDGAWTSKVSFRCGKCSKPVSSTVEQIVKQSILPRHAKKYQERLEKNKFSYDSVVRCKNGHEHLVRIRFEETQPARYQVELLGHTLVAKPLLRKIAEIVLIILLLSILPAAVIFANVSYFSSVNRANMLIENGLETTAVVVDRYGDAGGAKRAASYELTYEYQVDSQNYVDEKKVDVNTYNLADIDDEISIYYDPYNPDITDVVANDELFLDGFSVLLLNVVVIIVVVVVIFRARRSTRQ